MAEEQELTSKSSLSFVERLAEKLGVAVRTINTFGPAVEREGITVIPVSKVRYGFGGGAGKRQDQEGSGGGGGVQVSPVGFLEIKNGGAEFRPIRTDFPIAAVAVGAIVGFSLSRKLFRR